MGALSWLVAPVLDDHFSGEANVPLVKALLLLLTAGLIWQFVLVVILLWREQGTLRWPVVREALWLRSPRDPNSGRCGGRVWLVLIPLFVLFYLEMFLPEPWKPETATSAPALVLDLLSTPGGAAMPQQGQVLKLEAERQERQRVPRRGRRTDAARPATALALRIHSR
jgi:hypothetical protein